MTFFDIFMQRTLAYLAITKVSIVDYILRANIAESASVHFWLKIQRFNSPLQVPTMRARHLVTALFLDKRMLALVAMTYQGCRHGFFNYVS